MNFILPFKKIVTGDLYFTPLVSLIILQLSLRGIHAPDYFVQLSCPTIDEAFVL